MPDRSTLSFTVRSHEIDAMNRVLPGTIMRWCQDAAIYASDANGFDTARYRALGSTWFVREFTLDLRDTLRNGDDVILTTWAAGFERILAPRQYRIARPNGEVVALGEALWVYVSRDTGRPKRFDRELVEEFRTFDEHVLDDRDWGADLLDADDKLELVDEREHAVLWSELDGARHVNNVVYADWILDHFALASDAEPGVVRKMRIRFERGASANSTVRWSLARDEGGLRRQVVTDAADGSPISRAVIEVDG